MRKIVVGFAFLLLACLISWPAGAIPIFSMGEGSSVSVVNYSGTFGSIVPGMSLLNYTEDNLIISVDDFAFLDFQPGSGFDSFFHYGTGGNCSYVTIKTADSQEISGLEFVLGAGFPISYLNIGGYMDWEIFDDGISVGAGNSEYINRGNVVGWSDSEGFDELRVGFSSASEYALGSQYSQAIAIDNLKVQTTLPVTGPSTPVPEPATMLLFGSGLLGLALARRKKTIKIF